MARIEAAPEVFDDFDRFFEHLTQVEVEILQAVEVLTSSPLIGRSVEGGKRELVIGRGSHGYIALHRYVTEADAVFLLAVRSQREAGYGRDV
jgi:toxin ParE1/3/4